MKNSNLFPIFIYIIIVHILYLFYYENTFYNSYNGLLIIYDFHPGKYIYSIFASIITAFTINRQFEKSHFTNIILALLYLLYFIPGFVQQAMTNESWGYILTYFMFFVGLEFWSNLLKPINSFTIKNVVRLHYPAKYLYSLLFLTLLFTFLLLKISNTTLGISTLIETFTDVYGVRADAKASQMHWILLNIEYWTAYFIIFLVPFVVMRRNWIALLLLIVGELSLFLIQANRIFVFLLLAAIIVSFIKMNNRKLCYCFVLLGIFLLLEVLILEEGLIITDVYRRYTIVPNRIGGFYYDYFTKHSPDFLISHYDRFFSKLGLNSIYENNPIGIIIGEKYFGWSVNCNTGMLGGCMFNWGLATVVISTFSYVLSYRIFEMFITNLYYSKYVLAIILVSLSINSSALLANLFSISYFSFFLISLVPLMKSNKIQ